MTAVKKGLLWLVMLALVTLACWMGYQEYMRQTKAETIEAPVDAQYVDQGHYSEM